MMEFEDSDQSISDNQSESASNESADIDSDFEEESEEQCSSSSELVSGNVCLHISYRDWSSFISFLDDDAASNQDEDDDTSADAKSSTQHMPSPSANLHRAQNLQFANANLFLQILMILGFYRYGINCIYFKSLIYL